MLALINLAKCMGRTYECHCMLHSRRRQNQKFLAVYDTSAIASAFRKDGCSTRRLQPSAEKRGG